jgi:hypothetical protein
MAALLGLAALLAMAGCSAPPQASSPWVKVDPGVEIHDSLDVPFAEFQEDPEKYVGAVFEDRFKFYRIYHDKQDADPALRGQVILGETHFTARPVAQPLNMIQVVITPSQEAWLREHGIERQDAIGLRVRFMGLAPGSALAFELLEVVGPDANGSKP